MNLVRAFAAANLVGLSASASVVFYADFEPLSGYRTGDSPGPQPGGLVGVVQTRNVSDPYTGVNGWSVNSLNSNDGNWQGVRASASGFSGQTAYIGLNDPLDGDRAIGMLPGFDAAGVDKLVTFSVKLQIDANTGGVNTSDHFDFLSYRFSSPDSPPPPLSGVSFKLDGTVERVDGTGSHTVVPGASFNNTDVYTLTQTLNFQNSTTTATLSNSTGTQTLFSGLSFDATAGYGGTDVAWFKVGDVGVHDARMTFDDYTVDISPVPEPQQYALVAGLGLLGFAIYRNRSRQARQAS
jgi:hypothetical protein